MAGKIKNEERLFYTVAAALAQCDEGSPKEGQGQIVDKVTAYR